MLSLLVKKKEEKDKAAAEEQRKRAMETFAESKKRNCEKNEEDVTPRKQRKSGSDTMAYLREQADRDQELKQEELRARREETKMLRQMMAQQAALIQTLVSNFTSN